MFFILLIGLHEIRDEMMYDSQEVRDDKESIFLFILLYVVVVFVS